MPETRVLPFPEPLVPVSHVRSTLIQASVCSLREHGFFDRYRSLLPTEHHEAVLETLAPVWLPIACGVAHYRACEELDLTHSEQAAIGNDVARRVHRSALSAVVSVSRTAGVTPWLGLKSVNRIWPRVVQGGGAEVVQLGPKEARVTFEGLPFAGFSYFRNGFLSLLEAGAALFAKRVFIRIEADRSSDTRLACRYSWV